MKNNPNLKLITTKKINTVLIEICKNKNIDIQELIRQTYQFLMSLDTNHEIKNINIILFNVFKEYDSYEYNSLSSSFKQIKTHATKKQQEAYNKIERNNRTLFFNKLISIVINNVNYMNFIHEETIKKDPIINKFTIKYFLNKSNDSEILIGLMESLLSKIDHILNNKHISDTFFKHLYITLFKDQEGQDFILTHNLVKFLQKEFQKIYFCMLQVYEVKINTKASKGNARKVYKMYQNKYKNIYNQNLELFITSEINSYEGLSELEQFKEVFELVSAMHPSQKEQTVVGISFVPYCFQLLSMVSSKNSSKE